MRNLGLPGDYVRERQGWNSAQGDYADLEYEGTRDYIASTYSFVRGQTGVLECERTQQGAKWILRVRFQITPPTNSEEAVINELRCSPNRVQKSIFEPPSSTGLSAQVLSDVQRAVRSQSNDDYAEMVQLSFENETAWRLYKLGSMGTEYRTVYQPVLFRSRSAPAGFQWANANWGVGQILDNADLFVDAALAGILNFALPPAGELVTAGEEPFVYGWLKHQPWYDTAAGNRTVEYREYEYGLWPLLLFDEAS